MRKKLVIATSFIIIAITLFYVNSTDNNSITLSNSSSNNKNFNSGITIKDIGEMVIIEQKPNEATVIIDKDDLDSIIAFLNNSTD
tara:strand:- start:17 stop:271 length:255 start_codon:yes stop_codon:yes gene_type:complete